MQHAYSDMVFVLKRTVFDRLNVSVIESMKSLNSFDGPCTCVNTFGFLLHFGDIEAYEDSECSLNQRYEQRVTDRNGDESAKNMHGAERS